MSTLAINDLRLLVTMDDAGTEAIGVSLTAEDGWITAVEAGPRREADVTIDGRTLVAIPGLINTHHHLYQTLTRAFPESVGRPLFPWLRLLYPIWRGLDEDMILASTRAGLAELLLSGCTTCADHLYVFPPGSEGFIDAQVEAARSLGIRFHPTRGSMDLGESRGGLPPDSVVQTIDQIMADSERVIDRYHDPEPGAMVRVGLAPCSPFSVTDDLMRASAELARSRGVRLHTHIAETMDEDRYSRERYGVTPVELLHELGWLGPDVWLAHCVHPAEEDIASLGGTRSCVAHCPTSNMLLGSGLAPVNALRAAGSPVGLGVDGSASNDANDLRAEVKQAVLASRVRGGAGAMSVRDALRIATRGGADCLGRDDIGSLEAGRQADIVLFDAEDLALAGGGKDLVAAIVLGAARPHTVIVQGRVVVHGGRLATGDASAIAREQNAQSERLLDRARA